MDNWLDEIQIASPCSAPWESMTGDDRVRYCGDCKLRVYNVELLTRFEVKRLLTRHEKRLCLRLVRRADGTLITRDCPVGLRALRRRMARLAAAVATLLAALVAGALFPGAGSLNRKAAAYGPLERLTEWVGGRSEPPPSPPAALASTDDDLSVTTAATATAGNNACSAVMGGIAFSPRGSGR